MDHPDEQPSLDISGPATPSPPLAPKRSFAITGLFVLAVCYTLHIAQDILMPVTAAVILALLLQPAIRLLRLARIPDPISAGGVVIALFAVLSVGIYFLADPAAKWISQLPDVVTEVQQKIKAPMQEIQDAKDVVQDIVDEAQADVKTKSGAGATHQPSPSDATRIGLIELLTQTFVVLSEAAWSALIIFVLVYFLLAGGSVLRENIILSLPTLSDKKRALVATRDVQHGVSAYLVTVILINMGLGVAIGLAMYAIGLPNPALWGAMAAILNFIPYLGAVAGSVVVTIVALVTFDTPVEALLAPVVYIAINSIEGYIATPMILSRRLTINPIAVFLSVIFWGWMWGVPGALMAVPIMACLKVICDATERLAPLSQFLSGRGAR